MKQSNNAGEKEFLKQYDPTVFERPNSSVDTVIYTVFDQALHVLIVRRAEYPFKHNWSLVGGFIDIRGDNDLESTAKRKLQEKTGVRAPYLEQYGTVGSKTRDPRYWTVTTVYFALLPYSEVRLKTGEDAFDIKWTKLKSNKISETLAFDHNEILRSCCERLRNKVLYTSLPLHLVGETFTLVELQDVYEVLLDEPIDANHFADACYMRELLKRLAGCKQDFAGLQNCTDGYRGRTLIFCEEYRRLIALIWTFQKLLQQFSVNLGNHEP